MSSGEQVLWRHGPGKTGCGLRPLLAVLLLVGTTAGFPADLAAARQDFIAGQYEKCASAAQQALQAKQDPEEWGSLLCDTLLTLGRYSEALAVATNALASEPRSIRLRWSAREAFLRNGQTMAAAGLVADIARLFSTRSWIYRDPKDLIVYGRVALLDGMDPKLVLDRLYDRLKKSSPNLREVYLASGELALDKHDFALASRLYQEGLKGLPNDPDLHFGLAQAYAPGDQKSMLASLEKALELNPNHVGSLLLLTDHRIAAEDYPAANDLLDRVAKVNPWHPDAWAYRAVVAHLKNELDAESGARETALRFWPTNPRVDYLVGKKLSEKYRFAVGASHQKRALSLDPDYLPAKSQLAQDLLRLGEETEGWRLADEVQRADAYDVEANNLVALHDVIRKFQTLTNQHFILRMNSREAALYGSRALGLLEAARARLSAKYGLTLAEPTLVEMFNDQKDFAVRTFGMPDNDGFLGVCFGGVITANSPASRPARHFNWESMLWHEFCHAVTLQLTRNKMPRWLSEGISVFEERQANPAWGEQLNPRYREMILGQDLTPISKLSSAFLAPKSPVHLQFAYFESSLVVQFLVENFGQAQLLAILRELGQADDLNALLAKHTVPLPQLEKDFASFARKTAQQMAPGLDWEKPAASVFRGLGRGPGADDSAADPLPALSDGSWTAWSKSRPTNFWVMTRQAERLMDQQQWAEARPVLEKLVELYPGATGGDCAYLKLATVCRALGETNTERQVLTRFAERDDEAVDAYLRLMELASATRDWPDVITNALRYLAVDPLVPSPYRYLARASEETGQAQPAIEACRALLELDPANPAEVHYHLAKLLFAEGDSAARRHVLQALEEAPRYREALRLLRRMQTGNTNALPQTTAAVEARQ
ncbi:MAG TPA: tetratricopeptide repeat protein [Verrucomicrobiae bacterium]